MTKNFDGEPLEKIWYQKRRLLLSKIPEVIQNQGYRVFFARERRDFQEAFSLVYKRYLACNLIHPNDEKIFYTPYQALPQSRVCLAYKIDSKKITSTATIVLDNPLGLPSDNTYPNELQKLRSQNRKLAEITCLAAERDLCYRNGLLFVLRLLYRYARQKGVTDFVISIHPKHRDFYEKIFLFRPIGPIRAYKNLYSAPAILERLDLTTVEERYYELYGKFEEGKIFADFFLRQIYFSDIRELSHIKNMSSQDFWYFFMEFRRLFPSFPPSFQSFFAINFDLVLEEEKKLNIA